MEKNITKEKKEDKFSFHITKNQLGVCLLGNFLIGVGIAVLRVSSMGNDAYSAMTMSLSEAFIMSLGLFQILLNAVFFATQLKWGKKYIGIGTMVNMFLLGYLVEYSIPIIEGIIGDEGSHTFFIKIIIMIVGLFIVALGIAFYQRADSGIAPYDYISLKMTDVLPTPYFVNRIITDALSVIAALMPLMVGVSSFDGCHIGIGTLTSVCCLGPFVSLCDRLIVSKVWKE